MKLLIVEDDPLVADDLADKLQALGYTEVLKAFSVQEAKRMVERDAPDVSILDIDLGGRENGIDLGSWLDARGLAYFYLSGKQDMGTFFETTKTRGVINIEKPVSISTLRNTLFMVTRQSEAPLPSSNKVILPSSEGEHHVAAEDILYLKAARAYCEIYLKKAARPILASYSLAQMVERINTPEIVRIHRSHAVNIQHITFRRGNMLTVGEEAITLDIGRLYKDKVDRLLQRK